VLETDQKLQSWFSLGLWKMSKTSPIENASQHKEEFKAFSIADVFLIFCLKYFVPDLAGVWRGECPKALIFLSSLSKISFGIPQNKKQNFRTLPSPTRLSFPSNLKQKP
jgi:hypothetical protein